MLMLALASSSATRASMPGRLSRKMANCLVICMIISELEGWNSGSFVPPQIIPEETLYGERETFQSSEPYAFHIVGRTGGEMINAAVGDGTKDGPPSALPSKPQPQLLGTSHSASLLLAVSLHAGLQGRCPALVPEDGYSKRTLRDRIARCGPVDAL